MKQMKTGDIVGSIIGNAIAIVLVNSIPVWRQYTNGVVLETWMEILWAANLSLLTQLLGNLILFFYRPPAFAVFMKAVFAAASLVGLIVFFLVYPLDFSAVGIAWLNSFVKVVLAIAMGGTLLSLIMNLVRLATGRWHE
jgi:hypothetical protein